jgi:hypothetical protein
MVFVSRAELKKQYPTLSEEVLGRAYEKLSYRR